MSSYQPLSLDHPSVMPNSSASIFDRSAFRTWLEAHLHDVVGTTSHEEVCPLARWIVEAHGLLGSVDADGYTPLAVDPSPNRDTHFYPVPHTDWSQIFMYSLDATYPMMPVTGEQCLRILDVLQHLDEAWDTDNGEACSCRQCASQDSRRPDERVETCLAPDGKTFIVHEQQWSPVWFVMLGAIVGTLLYGLQWWLLPLYVVLTWPGNVLVVRL